MADEIQRLQEKVAYLERHVGEQDKAMLEMATQLEWLKREHGVLRERLAETKTPEAGQPDEKPPHY
ncbi:MAG: SlyX family protein [Opitutaceae bacterium]|nr:SlyX family protein [Opitutaceae bacterium]